MKNPLVSSVLIAAVLCSLTSQADAERFLFDFGSTPTAIGVAPDDPVNTWNDVPTAVGGSDVGSIADLQTDNGTVVPGMGLQMIRRFNGANTSGNTASIAFPENASRDSLYGNTEVFGGLGDIFPAFKLTGLNPALSYSFTFYASRMGVTDNRETMYTVTGANVATALLDPSNNDTDTTIGVEDVSPDAGGEITIELEPGENNNNGSHFTYLGVMFVETSTATGDVEITSDPEDLTVTEFDSASFSVSASGAGPFSVQWHQDGSDIPDADSFTYTIPEVSLALDGVVYSATVSNTDSSETSAGATLTVEVDNVAPTPLYASTGDGNGITVAFSEPLDAASANDPTHYTVSDADGAVAVSSVTLSADRLEVVLQLASPVAGFFDVTFTNLTDRAGNSIDPAANPVTGEAPVVGTTVYLFDFGGDTIPVDPLNTWNLVSNAIGSDDFGTVPDVVSSGGDASTISLEMISRFNGTNGAGNTASTLYPSEASGDTLYGNTEDWGGQIDVFPSFKLTGLDPNLAYTLNFYAARLGVGDNRETQYTVGGAEGDTVITFNPANNETDQSVSVESIIPTAENEITIAIAPGLANDNANHFTYLGVLRVDSAPSTRAPFAITAIAFEPSTNTVDLTFDGLLGVSYVLEGSNDLKDWQELDDSVQSMGEGTMFQFIDSDAEGAERRFYRLLIE